MISLCAKMKQEMTLRSLSSATQEKYLNSIIKLNDFYQCNPAKLNENDIKAFLLSPKNQALAASTYNIIIHGLRFFYEVVLGKPYLAMLLPRKREAQKLPDILSENEVSQIIKATHQLKYRTLFILIYGAGLRASEAISLRTGDLDRERSVIHIRCGKGNKDRYVLLSPIMLQALETYWKDIRSKQKSSHQYHDLIF